MINNKIFKICVVTIAYFLCSADKSYSSQTFYGDEGFINTPGSEVIPDRNISFGLGFMPGARSYWNTGKRNTLYSMSLSILPRTEAGVVFNQLYTGYADRDNPYLKDSAFDRSIFLRFQVLEDKDYFPSLVLGGRDIISNSAVSTDPNAANRREITSSQQIFYLAVGKRFYDFKFNLGYSYAPEIPFGFDASVRKDTLSLSLLKNSFRINGVFAAIETPKFFNAVSGVIEYDSKYFNYGLSVGPFWGLESKVVMIDLTNFNIKFSWSARL